MTVVYHGQLTTVKSSKISTLKTEEHVTILSMLPVIDHVEHDIPFQNHALCTAMDYTNYLNPGQTTVACLDKPLYALKKTIFWAHPAKFQKSDSCYITNYDPETQITLPPIKTSHILLLLYFRCLHIFWCHTYWASIAEVHWGAHHGDWS